MKAKHLIFLILAIIVADQALKFYIKLSYYAGFAWQKSGQVTNVADWDTLLQKQAKMLANPLKVTIKGDK